MKKKNTDSVILVPNAQVIITGKQVPLESVLGILEFTKSHSISNWCHSNGYIGHLDSIKTPAVFEKICDEFHSVARQFPFLELAITFMDNVPGSYNQPVVSYILINGTIKRSQGSTAHNGHPPPKRSKITS